MIELIALSGASASIVRALIETYRKWLEDREPEQLKIEVGGQEISVPARQLTPEFVASLEKALEASEQGVSSILRHPRRGLEQSEAAAKSPAQTQVEAVAFAVSSEGTFANARRQSDRVFRLYLAITIALAVIFVVCLLGAIVAGLAFGRGLIAVVFAGASIADVVAVLIFRPLGVMKDALLSIQRLDLIHLRLREQLTACSEHQELDTRIRCQNRIWNQAMKEIAALQSAASAA